MAELHLDFETRSAISLKDCGLWNYAHHPSTSMMCLALAFDDEPPSVASSWQQVPDQVLKHIARGGTVHAHGANFERTIWNALAPAGFPRMVAEQMECTMALALAMGLPDGLDALAAALRLPVRKDSTGQRAMKKLCRPEHVDSAGNIKWHTDPALYEAMYHYCKQDVAVEREARRHLRPLSAYEKRVYVLDCKINDRGVRVDVPAARGAVKIVADTIALCNAAVTELTAGEVQTVNALIPMRAWVGRKLGCEVTSLAKDSITALLADTLPDDVRQVLRLRQEGAKASTAKFAHMVNMSDSQERLHFIYQIYAATTGRWGGRGPQPQNLVRDVPPFKTVTELVSLAKAGDTTRIDLLHGAPLTALSRVLRPFFLSAEGSTFNTGDFSSIEGRGTAWVSGEQWKLDAFRAADEKRGPGIYELAYARAFGVLVESVRDPSHERQVGKVMELAFGYQGGVGSFHSMAKNYGVRVSDDDANDFKVRWRAQHPNIVNGWGSLLVAAVAAIANIGTVVTVPPPMKPVRFLFDGLHLWVQLPSKRALCYPYAKLVADGRRWVPTFMTVPNPSGMGKVVADPENRSGWVRVSTYGGALMENVVQALCRDIQADAMLRLDASGFCVVMHTHDDIVDEHTADRAADMSRIMSTPPVWCPDFPTFAKCVSIPRYGVKIK